MTNKQLLERTVKEINKRNPKYKVEYKDSSPLMKFICALMFLNPKFRTQYVTTIKNTVYFPSEKYLETMNQGTLLGVLVHEFVHTQDNKNILFYLKYLFPQILAPISLLLCFINVWVGLALFILFLLPLPAPGRTALELRGYTGTWITLSQLLTGDRLEVVKVLFQENVNKEFTGGAYYFMWPFGVKNRLSKLIEKVESGEVYKESVFESCKQITLAVKG
jgi:hypothetical protein